jgi:opacity protein-like surface antigen
MLSNSFAAICVARLRRRTFAACVGVAGSLLCAPAGADRSDLPPEVGYNYGEIETPRIAAMGGAQRAFSNSLEALFVNPANMAVTRIYHLGALAQIWPEANRQSYGGGAVDSIVSSARIAGGLGATWNLQDQDGIERQWTDLRFALAFPFSDQFFLGAGGRHLWLKEDGSEAEIGSSLASGGLPDDQILRGFSFDAGATLKPSPEFAISLVGANLNNPGTGFQPTSVGGGIGFGNENLTIEGDLLSDFTTWDKTTVRAMLGGELLAGDHVPLRLGYRYDQGAESHAVSAGIGYIERAFAAELAVRRVVTPSEDGATTIVFGFKYHLESTGLTPSSEDTF